MAASWDENSLDSCDQGAVLPIHIRSSFLPLDQFPGLIAVGFVLVSLLTVLLTLSFAAVSPVGL